MLPCIGVVVVNGMSAYESVDVVRMVFAFEYMPQAFETKLSKVVEVGLDDWILYRLLELGTDF